MVFRDFDEGYEPGDELDEPTFALKGHKLRCLSRVPAYTRYAMMAAAEADSVNRKVAAAIEFMRGVIHPDDEEAFERVMRQKHDPVTDDQFLDVFMWLVNHYIAPRPITRPSGSAGGPRDDTATSADASASLGSENQTSADGST